MYDIGVVNSVFIDILMLAKQVLIMHFVCSFHIKNMKTTGNFLSKLIMYKDDESNISKIIKSSKGLQVTNTYKQSNSPMV